MWGERREGSCLGTPNAGPLPDVTSSVFCPDPLKTTLKSTTPVSLNQEADSTKVLSIDPVLFALFSFLFLM